MANTVKVGEVDSLKPGTGKTVEAEGRKIALFNVDGSYCAMDDACTHAGGPLGEGELDGDVVVCPWHGAGFNVRTGAATGPPAVSRLVELERQHRFNR